jgi:alpha-tubulin suppressor-like RCC1 family protein
MTTAGDHNCALIAGGTVRCWGEASYGVLGYGNLENIGDDETPASAGDVDVGAVAQAVDTGDLNTCALLVDGTVRCWGAVHTGILDPEAADIVGDDETPASRPVLNFGQPAIQVSVGTRHACVLLEDKSVLCWGSNESGELGIASSRDSLSVTESSSVELSGPVRSISVGNGATCAVLEDGAVSCWGSGGIAGLGYGNTDVVGDDETPLSVGPVSLGQSAYAASVGRYDRCAVLECGELRCWGLNRFGSAGLTLEESVGDDELPDSVPLVEIGGPVKRVSVGTEIADERSCAVLFDNTIRCWGNQWSDSEDWRPVATTPIDLDGTVVDVVVGDTHACALMGTGKVRCWGGNYDGQLGNAGVSSSSGVDVTGS